MEKLLLPLLFLLLLLLLHFFTAFSIRSAPRGHVSLARLDVQRQQQQEGQQLQQQQFAVAFYQ